MKFRDFEAIISADRMRRYVNACGGNAQKGMTLYRYNLSISSEMLKIISCFEVALRNRIDQTLSLHFGDNWLRDSCLPGGVFDNSRTQRTLKIISKAYSGLVFSGTYTPSKLMAEMEFGIWKYMFSGPQYAATGQRLLSIFPFKPRTTPTMRIDNRYIFNELDQINQLRNRIAHHEPICFTAGLPVKTVSYVQTEYQRILRLFDWMGIDGTGLLYGIDHIPNACKMIQCL